jgi:bifunctional enzyme CysN/CysC
VQYVIRSQTAANPDFRGYAGTVASGVFRPGDELLVLPTGTTSRIASIVTADGEVAEAFPPMAVVMTLEDDIAVSRGDILCRPNNRPTMTHDIEATVCWMDERSELAEGRSYLLKHGTRTARASVQSMQYRLDVNGLHRDETASTLELNEIGRVSFRCTEPLLVDDYTTNRTTGSFIIIDPATNATSGAGVIRVIGTTHASPNVVREGGGLTRIDRFAALGTVGGTILFTGLSGAGKSTLAAGVEEAFVHGGRPAFLIDGDNLRHGLNGDLGFSDRDRTENVRRAGEVARLFAESGALALIALICPFEEDRQLIRALHDEAGLPYAEVFVDTSLDECERRDPKGLYARARAGQLPGFTGIDSTYEPPQAPDLVLGPRAGSVAEQVSRVLELVESLLR